MHEDLNGFPRPRLGFGTLRLHRSSWSRNVPKPELARVAEANDFRVRSRASSHTRSAYNRSNESHCPIAPGHGPNFQSLCQQHSDRDQTIPSNSVYLKITYPRTLYVLTSGPPFNLQLRGAIRRQTQPHVGLAQTLDTLGCHIMPYPSISTLTSSHHLPFIPSS